MKHFKDFVTEWLQVNIHALLFWRLLVPDDQHGIRYVAITTLKYCVTKKKKVYFQLNAQYSDASANEDNSFWNHIR